MRTLLRAGILMAAAAGFCVAFSSASSADMVEPKSALQPALLSEKAAKEAMPEPAAAPAPAKTEPKEEAVPKDKADPKEQAEPAKIAEADEPVAPTPAPEQVVRQAPAHLVHPINQPEPPTVAERIVHPLRAGLQHIGASLGRVVSACDVLPGTGAGGPVFVLAVLSMAVPLIRRRVVDTRWATDEDVPELLFAQELTPPG